MTTPPKKRGRPAKNPEDKKKYPKTTDTAYKITLKLGDKVLEGSGSSMLEALQSLQKPVKIVSRGILTVSKGEIQKQQILQIPRVRRLFFPLAKVFIAKQLSYGLK